MLIRRDGPYGSDLAYVDGSHEVCLMESTLAPLVAHLEQTLGRPTDPDSSPLERANACLRLLAQRGQSGNSWFTSWCSQAGVGYDRYFHERSQDDGDGDAPPRRSERWAPLERRADDEVRLLGVLFLPNARERPGRRPYGITLREQYWSVDFTEPYWYDVNIAYSELATVMRSVAGIDELADDPRAREDQWVAHLRRQVAAGLLGGAGPRGSSRDRVAGWYAEEELAFVLDGVPRRAVLLDHRDPAMDSMFVLLLVIRTDVHPPAVTFLETSQPIGRLSWSQGYDVRIPSDSIDALIGYLTERFGLLPPGPDTADERLVACLRQLVERGELRAGLPQRTMRQRMAEWLGAVGAQVKVGRSLRTEVLLDVHRQPTDSSFQLRLLIDPTDDTGISFWEEYEYFAGDGDAGREYGYGVRTPYDSLAALVSSLEERSGRTPRPTEDLEDRLAGSMRRLLEQGELGNDLPIKENCARVTAWFTAAGVPTEPRDWVWFNSE